MVIARKTSMEKIRFCIETVLIGSFQVAGFWVSCNPNPTTRNANFVTIYFVFQFR